MSTDTDTIWTIGVNNRYFPIANAIGEPLLHIGITYMLYFASWLFLIKFTKLTFNSKTLISIFVPFIFIIVFDFLYTFNPYAIMVDADTKKYIASKAPNYSFNNRNEYYGLEILDTSNIDFLPHHQNSGYVFLDNKFIDFINKNNIKVQSLSDKLKGWFKGTPGAWKKRSSGSGKLRSAADYLSVSYAAFYLITVTLTYATVLSIYNKPVFFKILPLIVASLICAGPFVAQWVWANTLTGLIYLYAIKVKALFFAFAYAFGAFMYIF